jgi:hypothetical protein
MYIHWHTQAIYKRFPRNSHAIAMYNPCVQVSNSHLAPMKLQPLPHVLSTYTVSLSTSELHTLLEYLLLCQYEAFTGINNYHRFAKDRELLYRYHTLTLAAQLRKAINRKRRRAVIRVPINYAAMLTMCNLFKRVDLPESLLPLKHKIYQKLKL